MYEKAVYISKVLNSRAEDLDIPESKYLDAKKRYEAVGDWLGKEETALSEYKPEIYPQGSFRLGTVVKPIKSDEYDIDLVCFFVNLNKENTTQSALKQMVGDRLKEKETYKKILDEEGRRCWTLDYADEFHMDILPSIADYELRAKDGLYKDAILITDKKKIEYGDVDWPRSNPKGYADWFFEKQVDIFQYFKKGLVEDVPDHKVRTPLQRAIQVLKRHRDIFFSQNNGKNKPISIIITTLAADLYEGQDNVFNAIYDILNKISKDVLFKNGKYFVPNPANPGENFANKWNENPALPEAFYSWIANVKNTFCADVMQKTDEIEIRKVLNESMGFSANKPIANDTKITPVYIKTSSRQNNKPWKDA